MTLAASNWKFVLPPAVDPVPHKAEIDTAVMTYRAILNTAVAEPWNYAAFLAGDGFFRHLGNGLAQKLRIVDADNPKFIEEAWRFNLASIGLSSAGITAPAVRAQLYGLGCHTAPALASRIAYTATDPAEHGTAKFNGHVVRAVEHVLKQMWWLLSDTTLDGAKVQNGAVQNHNYIDHAYGASLMFGVLQRDFPAWDAKDKLDGYNIWWFNIHRLALQLLGYRPAS